MASIFEAVREAVPVPLAAERYGLQANRAGMVRCPFHDDHTPSLKLNEDYFYCFGCGAGGAGRGPANPVDRESERELPQVSHAK